MRLFTALEISSEHKRLLSSLRRQLPGFVWYPPDTYHLTLRFIGDIRSRPMLEELDHALARLSSDAFQIEPAGVGVIGQPGRFRLVATISPSTGLATLQSRIEATLRRCGIAMEKRRFQPHISLGVGQGDAGPDIIRWVQQNNLMKGKALTAEHFTLFRSYRTSDVPHYEVCAEYPLGDAMLLGQESWMQRE